MTEPLPPRLAPFQQFETSAFVVPVREHLGRQFPRTCPRCAVRFADFRDYVRNTSPIGAPLCFDEHEPWPHDPVGTLSMVNCRCGTTLALDCGGELESGETYRQFIAALKADARRYSITVAEVLDRLRTELRGSTP